MIVLLLLCVSDRLDIIIMSSIIYRNDSLFVSYPKEFIISTEGTRTNERQIGFKIGPVLKYSVTRQMSHSNAIFFPSRSEKHRFISLIKLYATNLGSQITEFLHRLRTQFAIQGILGV